MIKILNKYEAIRICDECGEEKVIQKAYALKLLKTGEKTLCYSCGKPPDTNTEIVKNRPKMYKWPVFMGPMNRKACKMGRGTKI